MAQIIDENSEIHAPEKSAPPYSTPAADGISTAVASARASPLPAKASPPAQLQDLTERARGYIEAASSANTRKAYAADWKHFSAWCRRSNLTPLPPHPQTVGLYMGLSQIFQVNPMLTMGGEISARKNAERADDSECHCRKVEAPVEG